MNPEKTPASAGGNRHLWFLNTLVHLRISSAEGADGISVLEHTAPQGDAPPLHVHHTEDELFHILAGQFRFQVGGADRRAGPGEVLLAPKGVPHSYRVESPEGGRWITVTTHGDFEGFVLAAGRPAERIALPPPAGPLTSDAVEGLAHLARRHHIEFVGPPLT